MLTKEYERKKSELQRKIKDEEARYRNLPAQHSDARREIQALEDELERLELQYSQDLEKRRNR